MTEISENLILTRI